MVNWSFGEHFHQVRLTEDVWQALERVGLHYIEVQLDSNLSVTSSDFSGEDASKGKIESQDVGIVRDSAIERKSRDNERGSFVRTSKGSRHEAITPSVPISSTLNRPEKHIGNNA